MDLVRLVTVGRSGDAVELTLFGEHDLVLRLVYVVKLEAAIPEDVGDLLVRVLPLTVLLLLPEVVHEVESWLDERGPIDDRLPCVLAAQNLEGEFGLRTVVAPILVGLLYEEA